ncbi:MAG: cytochrome c [Burkholderiales bacterium]|uniref:c-type cytochrome n=1 Tax=Nitrosomonas sp. TaxID=42353 RepID=UPI001DE87FB2|nr:cytochrome c [Nitrosomonas sp.]MCB1949946.1 cytochrome c [Nitrosomonas sp.]MCP5243684.1 cytochrome c [Burkholderiales bacterium]
MKQKIMINLLLASSLLFIFSGNAQAEGDPVAGKELNSMCIGCHGIDGYRTAFPTAYNVPKIGGQHVEYLIKSLEGYRDGTRSHPSMTALAKTLTDQEIKDLAAFYASN